MGGAAIYPSDSNPTFSPVESSQLLHLQGRRVHKTSKYFKSYRMNVTVLFLRRTFICHKHDRIALVEKTVLLADVTVRPGLTPCHFSPCSAVCLRGLSELVELSVS